MKKHISNIMHLVILTVVFAITSIALIPNVYALELSKNTTGAVSISSTTNSKEDTLDLKGYSINVDGNYGINISYGYTLTIKDSSINKTGTVNSNKYSIMNVGTLIIEGGTFKKPIYNSGKVTIKGGTFYNEFDSSYLAEGYSAYKDKSTNYYVVERNLPSTIYIEKGNDYIFDFVSISSIINSSDGITSLSDKKVTGDSVGTTTLLINLIDGSQKEVTVKVYELPKTIYVVNGSSYTFTNDVVSKINSVQEESIATLSENTITGVSIGTTTLTVTLLDGSTSTIDVTVYDISNDVGGDINDYLNNYVNDEEENIVEIDSNLTSAIKNNENITTELEINEETETEEIKNSISNKMNEEEQVAAYYDINYLLKSGDVELARVVILKNPIKVNLNIPTNLTSVKEGYERTYYVIRIHNNVIDKLEVTYNEDGTVSFETDKFSTYILTYTDTLIKKEETIKPVSNIVNEDIEVPKTYDSINLNVVLGIISLIGLFLIKLNFKKEQ
jgi:hypothetical protein